MLEFFKAIACVYAKQCIQFREYKIGSSIGNLLLLKYERYFLGDKWYVRQAFRTDAC